MRRRGRLAAARGRDVDDPTPQHLDASFLQREARTTAMHVGGFVSFQEPIGVSMSVR